MSKVVLASINLRHPNIEDAGISVTYVFEDQPQAQDILQAYITDEFSRKHEHFNDFAPVLAQCLATYGVPHLNKFRAETDKGYPMEVTMVTARWFANLLGEEAQHNHEFGFIRIYTKDVISVQAKGPEILKTEVKSAKTAPRKSAPRPKEKA